MFISPIVLYEEFHCNFSGGKQIANYIKTNLNEEKEFIRVSKLKISVILKINLI